MHRCTLTPAAGLVAILSLLPGKGARANPAHSPCTKRSKLLGCQARYFSTELRPYRQKSYKDHGLRDPISERTRKARGFYLTPYWSFKVEAKRTAEIMKRAHMNAVVMDVKDDLGQVLYPSKVPLSKGVQRHLIPDPKKMIKIYHAAGIYVIARVVCFKDSRLPYVRPDLAVRFPPNARRLFSAGANWIDSYSAEVQDYIIDLVLEMQELGFDEIQLDYIRFPKGMAGTLGVWLHQDKRERATLIANFLERVDRALSVPMSVDIYGLTTLVDGDPRGLGQTIENMARYVEAISPMMYANGMDTYFKKRKVTRRVYKIIHCGLWRARQKAPGIVLRPFLQAYPNNVESFFDVGFIKGQVLAAERAGCNGFLFWNSTMRNKTAYTGLRHLGKTYFSTFGSNTGQYKKPKNKPGSWCPAKGVVWGKNGSDASASR